MKIDGAITILFGNDGMTIELHDLNASTTFAEVSLNPEQACQALSRLSMTDCRMQIRNLERIGKKLEHKPFEFLITSETLNWENRKERAREIVKAACPDGWTPDTGFNSQNSFFSQNAQEWARTTIRRWV